MLSLVACPHVGKVDRQSALVCYLLFLLEVGTILQLHLPYLLSYGLVLHGV